MRGFNWRRDVFDNFALLFAQQCLLLAQFTLLFAELAHLLAELALLEPNSNCSSPMRA